MLKTPKIVFFIFSLILCITYGCKDDDDITSPQTEDPSIIEEPISDTTTVPKTDDSTLIKEPTDTTIVEEPNYKAIALKAELTEAQPMTGIVLWTDLAKRLNATYRKSISLEFAYCLPSKVVKGKTNGEIDYDWSSFETMLDEIASRNHQAIIRFRYEYPGNTDVDQNVGTTAVPDYIKSLPDYAETYSINPNGDGITYYADWTNTELQWFTKQFYIDFAKRYDKDPRLAFLEVGFGHWSEYHISGTRLVLGDNFPTHAYQEEFLSLIDSAFQHLPWLISIDASSEEYAPIVKSSNLMSLDFGLFDDSFMHSEHELSQGEGYNEICWIALGSDERWSKAPYGGEISYYSSNDQIDFLNPSGMYGFTWEEASSKYHMTFVIANDATESTYGTPERFLEASLASGYRFQIQEFWASTDSAKVKIANVGIAPIYKDAYVSVNKVRSNYSLKALMPGESKWIYVASGGSNPTLAIESDFLVGRAIGFEADFQP